MNKERFARVFPLGAHLCREPMPPMAELKRDMENLRAHGFNLIKLQEHWAADEPVEGRCDFSRYEELIEYAARLDMGVYLGLTCEQAPNWLWRKHPDCRMVGRNGLPIAYQAQATLPSDGKPGPCYDHPGAMADQLRFIGQLVRALGRYENIVIWNTWQEIGYWAEGLVGQPVCYCAHTLEHWRRWLQARYGDLDGLNRAWHTRYGAWEDVLPDRCERRNALPQDVDWRYFMDNVQIAHVLRARAGAIRAADPWHRPVFAHKGGPIIGSGQDWMYARCQDFVGSSCYPAWGSFHAWDDGRVVPGQPYRRHDALLAETWGNVALRFDYIRCCNPPDKPVWAAEFQGGPVSTALHKGRVPDAADIRRWMLTAVGSGITALSFWVARAEIMAAEQNGFSLLDSVGEDTPRYAEAARVGAALSRYPQLFAAPTTPPAAVAIVVDEWNYQFCQTLSYGSEHLPYSVRGWYRLLWELGIPVDFVLAPGPGQEAAGTLDQYRALVLPFPVALAEETAAALAEYVARGGNLISEACPGRVDEHGFCRRGELSPAMRQLFGVAQETLQIVREPDGGARWLPPERTWGEYRDATWLDGCGPLEGERLRANLYVETFRCGESEPCLHVAGGIAGTVRRAGAGRAWLLGTLVGHGGTAYRAADTQACVAALLAQCGVSPERAGALLRRRRVAEPYQAAPLEAWLLTNPTDATATESLDVRGWREATVLLGEGARHGDRLEIMVPPLDVCAVVLER